MFNYFHLTRLTLTTGRLIELTPSKKSIETIEGWRLVIWARGWYRKDSWGLRQVIKEFISNVLYYLVSCVIDYLSVVQIALVHLTQSISVNLAIGVKFNNNDRVIIWLCWFFLNLVFWRHSYLVARTVFVFSSLGTAPLIWDFPFIWPMPSSSFHCGILKLWNISFTF